jgi:hypothetical protein
MMGGREAVLAYMPGIFRVRTARPWFPIPHFWVSGATDGRPAPPDQP